jgi:hypothetical protein
VPERGEAIPELQRRIADLRARLPKHSAPVAMMVELEDLEEALQRLLDQRPPGAEAGGATGAEEQENPSSPICAATPPGGRRRRPA